MFGLTLRGAVAVGSLIAVLCLVMAVVTMCNGRNDDRAKNQTANATGKALDTVTRKTETIRADQKEKQNEVETIEGSDQRLPDGYAAELQRLRDRERRNP